LAEFDLVVVGAGSSGSIIASKVANETGLKVLILEAGGSDFRPDIKTPIGYGLTFYNKNVNWRYQTKEQNNLDNRSVYCPRGKVVGGSASINAMVYVRGQQGDYNHWETCSSAEFGWNSVQSTFDLLEGRGDNTKGSHICVSNVEDQHEEVLEHFFSAARDLGIRYTEDMNGNANEGVGHYPITTKNGFRWTSADAFLKPAIKEKNVKIIKNAHVSKLIFDDNRVTGLEFIKNGLKKSITARFGVVLTAGAINTPQLLMLSGVGPSKHLLDKGITPIADIKGIGQNLQDHLGIDYLFEANAKSLNRTLSSWSGRFRSLVNYIAFKKGPFALSVNQGGGFVNWKSRNEWPNLQIYFNPLTYSIKRPGKRMLLRPDKLDGFAIGFQPCRPKSRGEVYLNSSNPMDSPIIDPKFLSSEKDIYDVEAGINFVEEVTKSENLKSIIVKAKSIDLEKATIEQKKEDFKKRAVSVYHPCGTCRLGNDVERDPVSIDFRLRGFQNIWIADASLFPSIPSGNINSAVMMLAYKASKSISQQVNKKLASISKEKNISD